MVKTDLDQYSSSMNLLIIFTCTEVQLHLTWSTVVIVLKEKPKFQSTHVENKSMELHPLMLMQ